MTVYIMVGEGVGESLGDSIHHGRGRGGRGYIGKYITHKH